jgi:hypothetical protein
MTPWVRVLIAFVVFCHGFIYIRIGSVLPGPIKEWRGSSWLLGSTLTGDRLTTLVVGLHVIAGIVTFPDGGVRSPSLALPWASPPLRSSGMDRPSCSFKRAPSVPPSV